MAAPDRPLRALAIMVLPAIAVWAAVTGGAIGMSPDSLFYWSAARTIRDYGVLATQVSPLDYARTVGVREPPPDTGVVAPDGSVTYPLTTWPPGYPLAVAAIMPLVGGGVTRAAGVLAVLTLLALIGAFAAVAYQVLDPRRAAYAAALAACFPFVHFTVRMMWSDCLFAALALLALALVGRALGAAARPGTLLVVAAVVAALATYVRYTGPLVLAAAFVGVGIVVVRDPGRRALVGKSFIALALYALLVAPLFARNALLTGHLTGGPRSPAAEAFPRLVAQLVLAFVRGWIPWAGAAVAGPRDGLISGGIAVGVWAVAGAAVLFTIRSSGGARTSRDPAPRRAPMTLLLIVLVALYATALLALRATWHFDFNTRMLLPSVAGVALLAVCLVEASIADGRLGRVNAVAITVTALATTVSLAASDHYLPWRGYNDADWLDRPVARWARDARTQAGTASLRFLSVGYLIPYLHFATGGAPAAGLPDEPSAMRPAPPGDGTVVVLEPGGRRFRCPEYQGAYERALDPAADSVFRGPGFTAWWLSSRALERLRREAKQRPLFRCMDRH